VDGTFWQRGGMARHRVDERVVQRLHASTVMSRCLIVVLGMVVLVAGCTDWSECKGAHRVESSDGNEPGTLRAATAFQAAFPVIESMSDGRLVCLTYSGFMVMDRELDVQYEGGKPPYNLAVGSDDTIYAVQLPGGYKTLEIELAAFEPEGALRWRQPLPGDSFARPLVAVPQGVYVETSDDSLAFFAAATGERRAMPSQALLDRNDLFPMTLPGRHTRAAETTIRRLDTTGATQWERTWKTPTEGVLISAAVATPEGGLIVAGDALETIDFGDRTLSGPGSFLVAIDASGATL
jgi:outer membrane protein assembly factor BamB